MVTAVVVLVVGYEEQFLPQRVVGKLAWAAQGAVGSPSFGCPITVDNVAPGDALSGHGGTAWGWTG